MSHPCTSVHLLLYAMCYGLLFAPVLIVDRDFQSCSVARLARWGMPHSTFLIECSANLLPETGVGMAWPEHDPSWVLTDGTRAHQILCSVLIHPFFSVTILMAIHLSYGAHLSDCPGIVRQWLVK